MMTTQSRSNTRRLYPVISLLTLLAVSTGSWAVEIQVSPNVLNLANSGEWVTIHTDLAYSAVVGATVLLNDVPISWWKSDDCGDFVAKFVIDDIKRVVQLGMNTLTLSGSTKDGETFIGTAEVLVINRNPGK